VRRGLHERSQTHLDTAGLASTLVLGAALTYKTHAEEYSHGELVRTPLLTDMHSLRCLPKEEDGRPFGGAEG